MACTVTISVFLTLLIGCILQAVNYSVLSDYFAQLVYIKRKNKLLTFRRFLVPATFLRAFLALSDPVDEGTTVPSKCQK